MAHWPNEFGCRPITKKVFRRWAIRCLFSIFLSLCLSFLYNWWMKFSMYLILMAGFEPQISGYRGDRSTIWAKNYPKILRRKNSSNLFFDNFRRDRQFVRFLIFSISIFFQSWGFERNISDAVTKVRTKKFETYNWSFDWNPSDGKIIDRIF